MSDTDNNTGYQAHIQSLDFTTFIKVLERINVVKTLYNFQLPNKATSYIKENESYAPFIQTLIDYTNPESDDFWRVCHTGPLPVKVESSSVTIGDRKLLDVAMCAVIPELQSVFIVPGDQSVKEGGFSASDAISLSGLISTTPLQMVFRSVPDEKDEGKMALSVTYMMSNPVPSESI